MKVLYFSVFENSQLKGVQVKEIYPYYFVLYSYYQGIFVALFFVQPQFGHLTFIYICYK